MKSSGTAKLRYAASATQIKMNFPNMFSSMPAKNPKDISLVNPASTHGDKPMMRITEEKEWRTHLPESNL